MHHAMKPLLGKALTVTGPVDPAAFGKVMMDEHLHSDSFDYDRNELVTEEKPDEARRQVLLNEAVKRGGQGYCVCRPTRLSF